MPRASSSTFLFGGFPGAVILFFSGVLAPLLSAFADTSPAHSRTVMGAATCASSACHGAAAVRQGPNVKIAQNEYFVWQKYDQHSKAWLALISPDGKRMAGHLGIANPEKEKLCLDCHATDAPEGKRGERFTIEDGVGCESCHGAAENYLQAHAREGATHADNLKNGMADIIPLGKRAALCLSCHQGGEDKAVTHRLIGAGHPRLSFELDTFSARQPAHWIADDDYKSRKGAYSQARSWLVGQAARAEGIMRALDLPPDHSKRYPELSLFYCYTCHHSLKEAQWKSRSYDGRPGELRLNLSSARVLAPALSPVQPALAASLSKLLERIPASHAAGKNDDVEAAAKVLSDAVRAMETAELDSGKRRAILKRLLEWCAAEESLQYESAEQVAMGSAALLAEDPAPGASAHLDQMFRALDDPSASSPSDFRAACDRFSRNF